MKTDWFPDWSDEVCTIVASGPSAKEVPLEIAKGKTKFIAINRSWELCPWTDVLYAQDYSFWYNHAGVMEFKGIKVAGEARAASENWNIHKVDVSLYDDRLLLEEKGKLGSGGNSGFQAINLAVQFGCKKIILVGYDMRIDKGIHWHGSHSKYMNNPVARNILRWRKSIDSIAKPLSDIWVKVINCSPVSQLTNYQKLSFSEALDCQITK